MQPNPADFQAMQNLLKAQSRWTNVYICAFLICTACALYGGANNGWPWMLGSPICLLFAVNSKIEQSQTSLWLQIYVSSTK